jgi:hypothetical protein
VNGPLVMRPFLSACSSLDESSSFLSFDLTFCSPKKLKNSEPAYHIFIRSHYLKSEDLFD